jgi:hypothetical protein
VPLINHQRLFQGIQDGILAADKRLPVARFLEYVGSECGVYSAYTQVDDFSIGFYVLIK